MPGLDPRAPLVLDLRDLGRRAGSIQVVERTLPAPVELGNDVIGVPAGSDLELSVRLESVEEGVLVSGTARVAIEGTCSRCLDPIEFDQVVPLQELYCYPTGDPSDAEDEDLRWVEEDCVDLEPALRDTVVPELPIAPVCREDCPGLCPQCGARLADDPEHHHETSDPRWAALAELLEPGRATGTERMEED